MSLCVLGGVFVVVLQLSFSSLLDYLWIHTFFFFGLSSRHWKAVRLYVFGCCCCLRVCVYGFSSLLINLWSHMFCCLCHQGDGKQ